MGRCPLTAVGDPLVTAADRPTRILGVSGSMREGSRGARALTRLLEEASAFGAETRLLDLRLVNLPMYRPGGPDHESIREMRASVAWADAFVLATPDYHGLMSGALKNFLDHNWTDFAGKLFGYICTSHEKGLTVMDQMRTAIRQCYGWSLPFGVSFNGDDATDSDGAIVDETVQARLRMTARDLTVYGGLLHRQFVEDLASDDADTFTARYRRK